MDTIIVIIIVSVAAAWVGWKYFGPMFSKKRSSPCEFCTNSNNCPSAKKEDPSSCNDKDLSNTNID